MKTQIGVNLQVEGFHCWEDAPVEVDFLRDRHRHIFHIECRMTVNHSNRDVEFILLKRAIEQHMELLYGKPCEFQSMSCEQIGAELLEKFDLDWCKVSEDDENYAIVTK